ncbi:hypothetical protein B0T21DRAFT_353689 [Apiosordaria backusii]|uniref:Uncharacterized protein n=1 Tax=Apiosordaria backusii TaxID=314023 RepID=A0AA40DFS2_9PEZI|nr:hypothetical protein B0T21DRAFT_353689 [Apiosordaria backusii]
MGLGLGITFYLGLTLAAAISIYRDGLGRQKRPNITKDVCGKFLTVLACIILGTLWPLWVVVFIIGGSLEYLFQGTETCCGVSFKILGNKLPKPVRKPTCKRVRPTQTPDDVERQAGRSDAVVDEQPARLEDIELPPYPGPAHIDNSSRR